MTVLGKTNVNLYKLVIFLVSRLLINLQNSHALMKIFLRVCLVRHGKIEKAWLLSFNVQFEAKIGVKSFDLSVDEDITPMPFIIVSTAAFLLFINCLVLFQNSQDPISFF